MFAAFFGLDGLIALMVTLAGLVLVVVAITQVVNSPGLTTGGKWGWGVGIGAGFLLYWLPGIILAVVFLALRKRWSYPRLN